MDIAAIYNGIDAKFLATADLLAALGGAGADVMTNQRFYKDKAPQNVEGVYVVYQYIAGITDQTFTSDGELMTFQFSIFNKSSSPLNKTTIDDVFKKLTAAYDDSTLTVSGYTSVAVSRLTSNFLPVEDDTQMYVVDYEIRVELN